MEPILVVDVGTATTQARVVSDGQTEILRDPASHEDYWPTAVARERDGFIVGAAAVQPATDQGLPRGRFLHALGRAGAGIALGDASYAAHELLARLLARLRELAAEWTHYEVYRVLLAASDGDDADALRAELLLAARLAGFTHVALISEATAAVLARGPEPIHPGQLLVCDAGASALRLTVLRTGSAVGTDPGVVVARSVFTALGGDEMDGALAARIREWLAKSQQGADSPGLAWLDYLGYANQLRHRLSGADQADVSLGTLDLRKFPYSRKELARLLRQPSEQLRKACQNIRRSYPGIQGVLVVGGCARTPFFAEMIHGARVAAQPDSAMADGAVVWARHAPNRVIEALPYRPGARDLAWRFKGAGARVVKWLVPENARFHDGDRLAAVRDLDDDAVSYLTADFAGTMLQHCVTGKDGKSPGDVVDSGQVLAVAEVRVTRPGQLCRPYLISDLPSTKALAFSPDGAELLFLEPGGACRLCDMQSGNAPPMPGGVVLAGPGCDVVRSPHAGWIAGLVDGRTVLLVSMMTGQRIGRAISGPSAIRFSGDGSHFWTWETKRDGAVIRVWEQADGSRRELHREEVAGLYGNTASSIAFSRDGKTLLLASRHRPRRRQREPAGGELIVSSRTLRGVLRQLAEVAQPDVSLAVAPDGGQIMFALGNTIEFRDIASGKAWNHPLPGPVRAAEFSADGNYLVTVGQDQAGLTGTLWNTRDDPIADPVLHSFALAGRMAARVLVSPDSRFLVTGDETDSTLWGLLS
jgi:Hsp70 protein